MFCSKCGNQLAFDSKICQKCGTVSSQVQNQETNFQNQQINVGPVPVVNQQIPVNPIHQEFGAPNADNQIVQPVESQPQINTVPSQQQYSSSNVNQYPTSNTQPSNNSNGCGVSDDELLQEFIGSNCDKILKTNKRGQIVNNPACYLGLLFGPIWFFYRKMYLFGFLIIIATYIVSLILSLFNWKLGYVSVAIMYFYVATQIYLFHAKNKIKKVKSTHPGADEETLKQLVRKKGGTSIISVIIYLVAWVGLVVLMFWVLTFSSNFAFGDDSGSYVINGTIPSGWDYSSDESNITNGVCTFTVFYGNPIYSVEAVINEAYDHPTFTLSETVEINENQWTKQEFDLPNTKVRFIYFDTDEALYIGQFTANTLEQFNSCENDFNTIEKSLNYK